MINSLLHHKTKSLSSSSIKLKDIQNAKKVLFALFTRYGDTIIDLVVIQEFVLEYPSKDYLILCPKQMKPYFDELTPNLKCIGINKRNYLEMFKLNYFLKKWSPDIGFNPWSFGVEGSFFLSYCQKYQFYKDFNKPQVINHYEVVRKYLRLPEKIWKTEVLATELKLKRVLICPESTDGERSISIGQINKIIKEIKYNFGNPLFTIASVTPKYRHSNCNNFFFKKTNKSSRNFIKLVKDSDLVICCDSAPLHIAQVFKKNILAVFTATNPEIVLNSGSKINLYNN